MEPESCTECERLMGLYREATDEWTELNKAMVQTAICYEHDRFTRVLIECHSALERCTEARHVFRDHMTAAHHQALP